MKKLILFILLCTITVTGIYAQADMAPHTENFTSTTIPTNWTQSSTSGGPFVFGAPGIAWNTSGCSTAPTDHTTGGGGNFAVMDHSSADVGVILEMNDVDISALTNPYFEFFYIMCGSGYSPVNPTYVEAWDGTTWNTILTTGSTNGWEYQGISISGLAYTGSLVKLRFRAESGGSGSDFYGDVAIDDVSFLEAPSCPIPSTLSSANVTAFTSDVSWTSGGSSDWIIEYGPSGFSLGSGSTVIGSTASPYTLTSLSPATSYDWYIRDYCGVGDSSSWAGPNTFVTLCAPIIPTYIQDFTTWTTSTSLPNCWEEFSTGTPATGPATPGSGDWFYDGFGNNGSNGSAKIELWNLGTSDWLVSPEFDLSAGGYQVDFDIALTFYNNQNQGVISDDDELQLLITNDGGVSWVNLLTWDSANSPSAAGDYTEFNLTAYDGDTVQFGWYGNEGTVDDASDVNFYFDNFRVREIPSCPQPTSINLTNLTATSVDVDWTTGGATNWIVEYGMAGFAQGSGIITNTSSNPFSISGLTPNTTYDVYITDSCGVADLSLSSSIIFTTNCSAYTAPYTQNFDATIAPATDACWTVNQNFSNTTAGWMRTYSGNFPGAYSAPNSVEMYNSAGTSATGSIMFVSPEFTDFDNTKRIKFWLFDESNASDIIIGTMSNPTDTSTFTPFITITEAQMADDVWEQHLISFASYTGTDNYVAFMHGANTSYDYIYLDDFVYELLPNCPESTIPTVNSVTDSSANLSWTAGGATNWIIEYDTAGFTPGTGNMVTTSSNPFDLMGLMDGTLYDWYVIDSCGPGALSPHSNKGTFLTQCNAQIAPYMEDFESATPNSIVPPICWDNTLGGEPWIFRPSTGGTGSSPGYGVSNSVDHTTGSGNFAWIDASGNIGTNELLSPMIDMSALTTPYVGYWIKSNNINDAAQNVLEMYAWDGSAWVLVGSYSGNNPTWTEVAYSLPAGIPLTTQFRLVQVTNPSGTGSAYYNDLLVDDFFVVEAPPCPGAPANLGAENITFTSTDLIWTNTGAATDWVVEWDTTGFSQGSGNEVSATDTFTSISGLTPNSLYEFYVRDYCGGVDSSNWAGPFAFFTGYCTPGGGSQDPLGITNVTMGSINNTTGIEAGSYGDFTTMITDAGQGVSFDVSVEISTGYTYNVWVWVDWNNDLDFTDAGEEFYIGETGAVLPSVIMNSILIPDTATLGNHAIRIGSADGGLGSISPSNPCYNGSWAAFEDYTLNIITCNIPVTTIPTAICDGDSVVLSDGTVVLTAGMFNDTLIASSGCDSVITYDVTVNMPSFDTVDMTACQGTPITLPGGTMVSTGGSYDEVYTNSVGCDSTVTYNVTLNVATASSMDIHLCDGDSYTLPLSGTVVTLANSYIETTTNSVGCDSVITYNVTTGMSTMQSLNVSFCTGDSVMLADGSYTSTAGTMMIVSTNTAGCTDSITYTITEMSPSMSSISDTICANDSYMFDGQMINTSGTYTATETNAAGCDSTITLTLVVNTTSSSTTNASICDGDSYMFDGNALTTAGTYSMTMSGANGCDSIVTLVLAVNATSSSSISATICNGDSYMFDGNALTTAGTYTAMETNAAGCDSTITLTLAVDMAMDETMNASICSGDSYVFGTQTLTSAGTYTETFTTSNGCSYLVTLNLTVNNSVSTSENVLLCGDVLEYILANGTVIDVAGIYTATMTASNGCDSIITYNVSTCVGIFDVENNIGMIAYPNPTVDVLNIEFSEKLANQNSVVILNVLGQTVYSVENTSDQRLVVNTSDFTSGIYYINVTSDNKTSVQSFTVAK